MVTDDSGRERQISRDRETIRNWADRHDVVPVREESGAGDGRYRMVPEERMTDAHERVEWNRFFEDFEDGDRVVVYHGEQSDDPFEVAGQTDVATELDDEDVEERLLEGETVTSTVTETAVVESVVTEELTVESELIDTRTVDQEILEVELLDRDAMDVELVDDDPMGGDSGLGTGSDAGTDSDVGTDTDRDLGSDTDTDVGTGAGTRASDRAFDRDRYLAAVGGETASAPGGDATTFEGRELPYHAEFDVEERWLVTRDVTDEYVVESHITGAEITEADTLEDYDLDVSGLHRTIAESGIIEEDLSTEDFLAEYEPDSELTEDDRVTTSFTRHRTLEDEILDRKRVRGALTGAEIIDLELVRTEDVVAGERERGRDRDVEAADTMHDTETGESTGTGSATGAMSAGGATLTEEDVGKSVVDPTGDEVGTVTAVDEGANAMYVDPNPGLTDRIKSALGWGGGEEDSHRLDAAHVDRVTDDEVRLDHREDMGEDASTSGRR